MHHRSIDVTIEVMGIIKGQFRFVAGWGTDLLLNVADRGIRVLFPSITRFSLFDEQSNRRGLAMGRICRLDMSTQSVSVFLNV